MDERKKVLKKHGIQPSHAILKAMQEYADNQCYVESEFMMKPREELKPLEELYRLEHPRPDGEFYLPDTTTFYKWIREKIITNN